MDKKELLTQKTNLEAQIAELSTKLNSVNDELNEYNKHEEYNMFKENVLSKVGKYFKNKNQVFYVYDIKIFDDNNIDNFVGSYKTKCVEFTSCYAVVNSDFEPGFALYPDLGSSNFFDDYTEVTKSEFNSVVNECINKFNEIINE